MPPPSALDAAIIFAPVGSLVPKAMTAVKPGGSVVCAGIHMSDIPSFPYAILWGERVLRSVANLTRQDGAEFLHLAAETSLQDHGFTLSTWRGQYRARRSAGRPCSGRSSPYAVTAARSY